jgi:putrescine aminotransferase
MVLARVRTLDYAVIGAGSLVAVRETRTIDEALAASEDMLSLITGETAPDPALLAKQAVDDHVNHYTPGLVNYRKSVTETDDFAATEWTGEGSIVRDAGGREWIDCLGGYGIYNLGIRHPDVLAAVEAQLGRNALPTQELIDPIRGMLVRLLATIAPGDISNAFVCNSGTEAIEGAMKVARIYTRKPGFIAALGGFHGKTQGALSLMGKASFREPFLPLLPGVRHVPYGDAAAVDEELRRAAAVGEGIAAVVMEPIQGEAGAVVPPDQFWPELREVCDRWGVLLIADEVQTGLGRTGALWGVDHWDVVPDIVCVAKSLGGGVMPVAAFMGRPHIWRALEPNPFLHTSTFGGSPLACAAAIASIHVTLRDRLWEQAARKGERFMTGLEALRRKHDRVLAGVQGRGLLIGMRFPDHETGYRVASGLFRAGVLVAGTQISATTVRIEPALTMPDELIDEVLRRLDGVLGSVG